jgi:hypothetical protein
MSVLFLEAIAMVRRIVAARASAGKTMCEA